MTPFKCKNFNRTELRNIVSYSCGKAISILGTTIFHFALGFYVLQQTGSALSFAISLLLGAIPGIIMNPIAGVVADKFNKKSLAIVMEFLNGMVLIGAYVISINVGFHLPLIYATILLMNIFTTVYGIVLEASKPNLVSEKRLLNINSISKMIDSISSLSGPMIGGVLFIIIDIEAFFLLNSVCFILSGLMMMTMDFHLFEDSIDYQNRHNHFHFIRELQDGFSYFWHHDKVRMILILMILVNFFLGLTITIPLPYILNVVFKLDSQEYGMIQAAFPVGIIIGASFVAKVMKSISYLRLMTYLGYTLSFLIILSGLPVILRSLEIQLISTLFFYTPFMLLLGLIIALIDIPLSYLIQNETPDEYRGRVLGIGISLGKILLPVAMLASGLLLKLTPPYVLPVVGGILYLFIHFIYTKKVSVAVQFENNMRSNHTLAKRKSANN